MIGALSWTTAQFAAFSVFRYGRALPALAALGTLLFIDLGATPTIDVEEQLAYVVGFSCLSLLLVTRLNLVQLRAAWGRRRIVDSAEVSSRFLGSGVALVAIATACAIALTSVATAAPLSTAWEDADDGFAELTLWLRGLGLVTPALPDAALFPEEIEIQDRWDQSATLLYIAETDARTPYWRGAAYDSFDGRTWRQRGLDDPYPVPAGQPLLELSSEGNEERSASLREVGADIEAQVRLGDTLLAPEGPDRVDRDARVYTVGQGGAVGTIRFHDVLEGGARYRVTAWEHREGESGGGLTQARLAEAGEAYPPAIVDDYVSRLDPSAYPVTIAAAERIRDELGEARRDPFHVAAAIERWLRDDGGFEYATDVTGDCRPGEAKPECLLRTERGFCQQFATTMVMMLRHLEIPSRYVQGFLPGEKVSGGRGPGEPARYRVEKRAAHAWVEVYFPGYGWMRFDPTPGIVGLGQDTTPLPVGRPSSGGEGGPDRTPGPETEPTPEPTLPSESQEAFPPLLEPIGPDETVGLDAVLVLTLVLTLALLALVVGLTWRLRRLPPPESDLAYRGVVSLASRLGHGPRPTQTAYEYVATLSELMPALREDLDLVAQVRVESAYAHRPAVGPRLRALRAAYARVRLALLRLLFRRPR
jgi:transglutaminase-like putative cysteine protease